MLFEIDLKNAEARVVSYMSYETTMIDAYEKGLDVYKVVGSKILGIPYEQVSREPGSSGFSPKSQRDMMKEVTLAFQYGMKYKKFAEVADIPEKVALELREAHLTKACPNLQQVYWPYCEEKVKLNDHRDLFGKLYRFYGLWGDDLKNRAYDFVPQSTIARVINDWGLLWIWEHELLKTQVQILVQEHDSVKYQIRDEWPIVSMIETLPAIITSLERPLHFENPYLKINGAPYQCEFVIPCETAAGYNLAKRSDENPDGLLELDLKGDLEKQLTTIQEKHRERI